MRAGQSHHLNEGNTAEWDDFLWEPLITSISRGKVIPIVGPELSIADIDESSQVVRKFVAGELADQLMIDVDKNAPIGLNDVVRMALRNNHRPVDIYPRINHILNNVSLTPGQAVRRLAGITDFNLFINLSFDTLLEQALAERDDGEKVSSISYHPKLMPSCDLPGALHSHAGPLVYYLLGKHSAMPEYAVSEGDLLEYVFGLQSYGAPRNLLDFLKDHSLLFLGGAYPDWLLRILLRLTRQRPLASAREMDASIEIFADSASYKDQNLIGFLSDFSTDTRVFRGDATSFVEELWQRWKGHANANPVKLVKRNDVASLSDKYVFISYCREDSDVASRIFQQLQERGISVWMDTERLEGGQNFAVEIRNRIRECELFVPLLSQNTEGRLKDAFFRREWKIAEDVREATAHTVEYIFPLVVDDTKQNQLYSVPESWREFIHISHTEDGLLTERTLDHIDTACRTG